MTSALPAADGDRSVDVIVVGAGPGGSATAAWLAKAGKDVYCEKPTALTTDAGALVDRADTRVLQWIAEARTPALDTVAQVAGVVCSAGPVFGREGGTLDVDSGDGGSGDGGRER